MTELAVRTYLEMRDPAALRPARLENPAIRIEQVVGCAPSFWRYLYTEVGRQYRWIDRLRDRVQAAMPVSRGGEGVHV